MKLAESSNGVKVKGSLGAIFLPLVVGTGTGAIGSLEWHKTIFWRLYHSKEALGTFAGCSHALSCTDLVRALFRSSEWEHMTRLAVINIITCCCR